MKTLRASFFLLLSCLCGTSVSYALDLDWTGQFRADSAWLSGVTMGAGDSPSLPAGSGYTIHSGGNSSAQFQSLFMRVKPSLVVNDNVYLKSEWWLGSPVYGFYGSSLPYSTDQRQFNSTFSGGAPISAQRFWGEFVGDLGTLKVGRLPLHWGLGVVWNNGDQIWDRYMSTGDAFSIVSKFGSFTLSPSIIKYGMGNSIAGNCSLDVATGICSSRIGSSTLTDYSIAIEYQNLDDDTAMGLNFIRRIGGSAATDTSSVAGLGAGSSSYTFDGGTPGLSYNIWDIYAKKRFGKLSTGIEVPIVSGKIGGTNYSAVAAAAEVGWKADERFEVTLRGGRAPGQPNKTTGTSASQYEAFYFHQNYRPGLILFNYALHNFGGPNATNNPNASSNALVSPYDNPITNATFVSFGASYKLERWGFRGNFVFASAAQAAGTTGDYFNTWRRRYETVNAGAAGQSKDLGWEMDYGLTFRWDDNVHFDFDLGWYFPGAFYAFSNQASGATNPTSSVFAALFRVGVGF